MLLLCVKRKGWLSVLFLTCRSFDISNFIRFNSNFQLCPMSSTTFQRIILALPECIVFLGHLADLTELRVWGKEETWHRKQPREQKDEQQDWTPNRQLRRGPYIGLQVFIPAPVLQSIHWLLPYEQNFLCLPPCLRSHSPLTPSPSHFPMMHLLRHEDSLNASSK